MTRQICQVDGCQDPVHGHGFCGIHYKRWVRHGDPLIKVKGLDFWEHVAKDGNCWIWASGRDSFGYGLALSRGLPGLRTRDLAHRISWVMHNGPIPDNLCVLHTCDNPSCVRPDHLFLGTRADNSADMIRKGRGRFNEGRTSDSFTQGSRNRQSKMTEAQVVEMRQRARRGEHYSALAESYGIAASTANAIIIGNGWRHVWPYFETRSGNTRPEAIPRRKRTIRSN